MSRPRGGFIGHNPAPAASALNSAAGGIWTLREAEALKRAGTWPTIFSGPTSVSGLQLWLDASDASTLYDATSGGSLVAADGGVARWEDKSGNGRHMTQSTAGSRPVRKTAQQNGYDTLLFAAAATTERGDDILIGSDFGDYLQSGASMTFFAVMKTLQTAVRHELVNKQDVAGGWRFLIESDDKPTLFFDDNSSNRTTVATTSTVSLSSYSVLAFKASGGSLSSAVIYKNGNALATTSSGAVSTVADNAANLEIGGALANNTAYDSLDGNIAEIIIYNAALSDTDREAVENYLMTKWGIS